MNIHEYQAKAILSERGVATPKGHYAGSVKEAVAAAEELGGSVWAVKAQIHAGGRGKAGGVKIARNLAEVEEYAKDILGKVLVTPQTSASGQLVRRLYVESGENIAREIYLSLLVDGSNENAAFVVSNQGGMNIEEVAANTPEEILTLPIDATTGFMPWHGRLMAKFLGMNSKSAKEFQNIVKKLYATFVELDASLIEINPLIVTDDDRVVCLDAKMNFDDNGLFRHAQIQELRDLDEEDEKELEASKYDLSYISLDGDIGCMVNGAGLAMATMDLIHLNGGNPANFLDVGGGASAEKVAAALRIIFSDPKVKGILVNIFGGIMRCDIIAHGMIAAANEVGLDRPLVVRLAGTNVEMGKKLLAESDLPIIAETDLSLAAKAIVEQTSNL